MKSYCYFFLIIISFCFLSLEMAAQVGINTDGSSPDPSAMLDVKSTDKGLLIPRSDTIMVNANGTPAIGLILYQSSDNRFYYFNGTKWIGLNTGSGAFEKFGNLVRQVSGTDTDNLIFGRETLPVSGEMIWDTLLFFNQQKGAFRGGMVTNDDVWAQEFLGLGSFAYGQAVNSLGKNAVAMGNSCYASGDYSVAMGRGIYSPSPYEFGFGKHNTIYTPVSTSGWHDTDRLFSIGNGTVLSPSNALTMLKNGHMGLGTENPRSHFSIKGEGSNDWTIASYTDAFNGRAVFGSATSNEYGTFNYGGYFHSDGDNGAGVKGIATKDGFSFASGGRFESAGDFGYGVYGATSGEQGIGLYGIAYGTDTRNIGVYGTNSGSVGFAAYFYGKTHLGGGDLLFGLDERPAPSQQFSGDLLFIDHTKMAFRGGRLNLSEAWAPDNIGNMSFAYGENTEASGYASTAFGLGSSSPSAYETSIGTYNTFYTPNNPTGWHSNDRLFSIGNGQTHDAKSNALTVLKNGNIGIGTETPTQKLEINGKLKLSDDAKPPVAGSIRYNEDTGEFEGFTGTVWLSFTKSYSNTWGNPYSPEMSENETFKNADPYSNYGQSVSIDSSNIIIGLPSRDFNSLVSVGTALIKKNLGSTWWSYGDALIASDYASQDHFGYSVAIHGNYAIVGAPDADIGTNIDQGAAYVFYYDGNGWDEIQKLTAVDGQTNDHFGKSVAIYGEYAVVGSPETNVSSEADQGTAYVYHFNGSSWIHEAILISDDGEEEDFFGSSVDIYDDWIVVGAPGDNVGVHSDRGSAYVYYFNGSDWSQHTHLNPADGILNDAFGTSVAIHNSKIVVGSPRNTVGTEVESGAAYLFSFATGTWNQIKKLNPKEPQSASLFGHSVDIYDNEIIVGAKNELLDSQYWHGAAYIFGYFATDYVKLRSSNGREFDHFGTSVSIYSKTAAVGAPGFDNGIVYGDFGAVYIFNSK